MKSGGRNTQVVRQWELFRALVTSRYGLSLSDCCAIPSNPVSSRTVRRDLEALAAIFPLEDEVVEDVTRYRITPKALPWLPSEASPL